jgi:sugar lactone lactonase YvrE
MAPRVIQASLLLDARASLGEAPQWDAAEGALVWVDILAGTVFLTTADGGSVRSFDVGRPVGAALPAAGGGWLLADADGFSTLAPDGRATPLLDLLVDRPELRFNDAMCDPFGRAWAGTISAGMTPGSGTLYRLDPGPRATPVLDGLTVSNGLAWSPDGGTMWFADSADPCVRGFDYDVEDGRLGPRRHAIELRANGAKADGLCVDDEGCVWVAAWGGGVVHRYTPAGRLDTVVEVPAAHVTSCAFGGEHGGTLFITSARAGRTPGQLEQELLAGGLFVVEPRVTGPAATPWRPLVP